MPHVILTHSKQIKDFDYTNFFSELNQILSKITEVSSISSRVYLPDFEYIGHNNPDNLFMSLTLKILKKSDRTIEVKNKLAEQINQALSKYTKQAMDKISENKSDKLDKNLNCPVMVEIVDLADTYVKNIIQ